MRNGNGRTRLSPTDPGFRVAIYCRVSTGQQDPDVQLHDLRALTVARGWAVVCEYVDHGFSGTKERRPALDQLMVDAKRRLFDAVLVWRFDRFARSTRHLINALHEFRHLGIAFVSYQESLDTSSPMGEAMFAIIGAMAQLERDIIRERVMAGLRNAKASGTHIGRPKAVLNQFKVERLRAEGVGWKEVAQRMGVSRRTLYRYQRVRQSLHAVPTL